MKISGHQLIRQRLSIDVLGGTHNYNFLLIEDIPQTHV
jgi:hypothetical protein